MGVYEAIILQLNSLGNATKNELLDELDGKYSSDEFNEAMDTLEQKLLEKGAYSSIKKKGNSYTLTSAGKTLFNMVRNHTDIAQFLQEQKNLAKEKENLHNNSSQNDEIKELLLDILRENEYLELGEIIALATQKSKNYSNEYLIISRKVLSQLVALGFIKVENKLYSINKDGNANASLADIKEPMSNAELKALIKEGADLNKIYVGNVKDFSGIFENYSGDLKGALGWDTWHIENMNEIFKNANLKGADLSGWEVNNVKSLKSAFENASGIKGIESWETESLENMDKAFKGCVDFNLDISEWRTEQLKSLNSAFEDCKNFSGHILNDWNLAFNFSANNAFKGAKSSADWANDGKIEHEFYIYRIDEIPSDFESCNLDEVKAKLHTGISWLRDEVRDEFKFYFKELNNKRTQWECAIEIFNMIFLLTPIRQNGLKNAEFKIRLQKLLLGDRIDNEEAFVNPFIKLIQKGKNYSTGQNNDDIYFGYKGIFVDSRRFSLLTRTAILYILARAYKEKLEDFIRQSSQTNANLSKINEEACKFNLEKYFTMPVMVRDGALQAGIWAKIYELYDIDATQAQVRAKISTMASILEAQDRARFEELEKQRQLEEKERDAKNANRLYVITTIITIVLGVLPLVIDWIKK